MYNKNSPKHFFKGIENIDDDNIDYINYGQIDITIIQPPNKQGRVEIIRNTQMPSKGGFFVNESQITTNNKKRNSYFRELLKKKL